MEANTTRTLAEMMSEKTELIKQMESSETWELTPEMEAAIDALTLETTAKVDRYFDLIDALDVEGSAKAAIAAEYRAKADRFSRSGQACLNVIKRLKARVLFLLNANQTEQILGTKERFQLVKCQPRLEYEAHKLPEEYKMVVYQADTEKIKAALKDGKTVMGASLVGGLSVRRLINRGV